MEISFSEAEPSAVFKKMRGALSIIDWQVEVAATTIRTERRERK